MSSKGADMFLMLPSIILKWWLKGKILFFYGNKAERLNAYCKYYQYQHSPSNFQNITRYSISIYYTIFCLNYQFLPKTYSAKFNTSCFFLTLNRGQASTKCLFVHIPSRNWMSKTWIIFANGSEICKRPRQNVGYWFSYLGFSESYNYSKPYLYISDFLNRFWTRQCGLRFKANGWETGNLGELGWMTAWINVCGLFAWFSVNNKGDWMSQKIQKREIILHPSS